MEAELQLLQRKQRVPTLHVTPSSRSTSRMLLPSWSERAAMASATICWGDLRCLRELWSQECAAGGRSVLEAAPTTKSMRPSAMPTTGGSETIERMEHISHTSSAGIVVSPSLSTHPTVSAPKTDRSTVSTISTEDTAEWTGEDPFFLAARAGQMGVARWLVQLEGRRWYGLAAVDCVQLARQGRHDEAQLVHNAGRCRCCCDEQPQEEFNDAEC
jgi:hypothetical protein